MKELTRLEVLALNSLKRKAIELGHNGIHVMDFRIWYGKNDVGTLFNKDGHCAEVVLSYMAARFGARVSANAKMDFGGVDLLVNDRPIQVKYRWREKKKYIDLLYRGRTWRVHGKAKQIIVGYPEHDNDGLDVMSMLTGINVLSMLDMTFKDNDVIEDIQEVWHWFINN